MAETETVKAGEQWFVVELGEWKDKPQASVYRADPVPSKDGKKVTGWKPAYPFVGVRAEPEALKDLLREAAKALDRLTDDQA